MNKFTGDLFIVKKKGGILGIFLKKQKIFSRALMDVQNNIPILSLLTGHPGSRERKPNFWRDRKRFWIKNVKIPAWV